MKHIKTYDSINEAKFNFTEAEIKNAAETLAKAMTKADKVKVEVHDFEYDKGRGAGFELSYDGDKYDGGSYYIKPNGDVINAAIKGGTKYGTIKSSEKDYLKYFKANESINEAEDYKYKKYVTKAFDKISDAMFEFRNGMGVKQLGQSDPKLKKRLELMQAEIFALRRDLKSEGLTESKDFAPHMMYDPETGDEYKAEKPEDHERMAKLGYVHEKPEGKVNESSGSEERRIALRAIKSIAKYLNRDLPTSAQYLLNATEDVQRDIKKGKIK